MKQLREPRHSAASDVRTWMTLAVTCLVVAGLLAVVLVIGRMPPFDRLFTDPGIFRRCLVVHVDLSLVCWLGCFLVAAFHLLPTRKREWRATRPAALLSTLGITMMVAAAMGTSAEPILANYVPVLDHPLFSFGLAAFFGGLVAAIAGPRLFVEHESEDSIIPLPASARPGLRAAAVALLFAVVTFFAAWLVTSKGMPAESYYEVVAWGGGLVLQFATSAAMLAVWLILVASATGRDPLPRGVAAGLFGLLVLPLTVAPLVAVMGTTAPLYRLFFTRIMQWGIFPIALVVLGACLVTIARARRDGDLPERGLRDVRLMGFLFSASLCLLGFGIGAMIRESNTVIPGHYHASIGAVTASFMTLTWVLLEPAGLKLPEGRMARATRWQPAIFGFGQAVFAIGFAIAGLYGAGRKMYGTEQVREAGESVGLAVMGTGGLIACIGGILFLAAFLRAWWRRTHPVAQTRRIPVPLTQWRL